MSPPADLTHGLRPAGPNDLELLWRWANDPEVRASSFHPEPIPFEDHRRWYAAKLASRSTRIWILEEGDGPVAQVRYELEGDEAVVGVSVAAEARGRGHARRLLAGTAPLACEALRPRVLVAYIMPNNAVSLRAFVGSGYGSIREVQRDGQGALRCERACADLTSDTRRVRNATAARTAHRTER